MALGGESMKVAMKTFLATSIVKTSAVTFKAV